MKDMTLTDFFKGNETHRNEYIIYGDVLVCKAEEVK